MEGPVFFSCHKEERLAESPPTMSAIPHQFNRRAGQYEAHATVQREMAAWLAEWLPAEMPGPALELGAGTGLFTRHLVARTKQLLASDISPCMVSTAAKTLPLIEWTTADAQNPPGQQSFRWILSCSLVQWLPDPADTFRAWHRASAPGARMIGGWFVNGTLGEFLSACPDAAPFVWRDAREWTRLLTWAGWQPVRQEEKTCVRYHRDAATLLREVHNAGAIVPGRLGPGALRAALRRYDAAHGGKNEVTATFRFLRVEAVRV